MDYKYFPLNGELDKPAMGLLPLELKDWIEIDQTQEKRLLLKEKIFRENKNLVLQINPQTEAACFELEEMVRLHVLEHFPDQFSMAASELYVNATGYSFSQPQNAEQALLNASQYVQEDFAFLSPETPFKLIGGSICFPSRWSIQGSASAEKFLEKISIDQPVQTFNWTRQDTDQILIPAPSNAGKDNALKGYVRVERQTLRRMPKTKMVLLAIRTYIHPL